MGLTGLVVYLLMKSRGGGLDEFIHTERVISML